MFRIPLVPIILFAASAFVSAQDADAKRVLDRYEAIRPGAELLSMYRLDWASSLNEALERSTKEARPIFLVIIHAKYGDIAAGHC